MGRVLVICYRCAGEKRVDNRPCRRCGGTGRDPNP